MTASSSVAPALIETVVSLGFCVSSGILNAIYFPFLVFFFFLPPLLRREVAIVCLAVLPGL